MKIKPRVRRDLSRFDVFDTGREALAVATAELLLASIQRTRGPQDRRLPDRNLLSNGEAFPASRRP